MSGAVATWRAAERRRLRAARLAVPADVRRRAAEVVARRLEERLQGIGEVVASLYWPFGGELDLRPLMHALHASGTRVALPVVEAPARPLIFRAWTPEARLVPGVWRIPVPADGEVLVPSVVVAPLLGYDGACYRLGYGGGFFDRTLARLAAEGRAPLAIGVAHSGARIPTIRPQPHDVAMDAIVTESEEPEAPARRA